MKYIGTEIHPTKSGNFKAYIWGQPADHYSNWTGCDFRRLTVPQQPRTGFLTAAEAQAFVISTFSNNDLQEYSEKKGDGSSYPDMKNVHTVTWTGTGTQVEVALCG